MSGLSRRVAVLETTRVDALYQREAERLAEQYGGSVTDYLDELHGIAAEITARFGPRPDLRAVANWLAHKHRLDGDELYTQVMGG